MPLCCKTSSNRVFYGICLEVVGWGVLFFIRIICYHRLKPSMNNRLDWNYISIKNEVF